MIDQYFAHTLPGKPPADWQTLEQHLKETAEKTKEFASAFSAGDWGYLAGLWHDLGKCFPPFQEILYLINEENYKECLTIGENNHV